jgi:hypothetical protein
VLVNEADNILQSLKNKSILIYTLTESVALRVKSLLESFCNGVTVYLSHEKASNDRRRLFSINAYIIAMATARAKHTTPGFNKLKNLPILHLTCKGSANMLWAIYSFLAE